MGERILQPPGISPDSIGAPNGIAPLDGSGLVPSVHIPPSAIPSVHVVADAAARLALTVQEGDEAIQLDTGVHYIFDGTSWHFRPGAGMPALHASTHESGGGDDIDLANLGGNLTGTQHGNLPGGSLHDLAQGGPTPSAGFISGAEKDKLAGIAPNATNTPLATVGPSQVDAGDSQATGASSEAAKADHQHAVNTGADGDISEVGSANAGGSSSKVARADHTHAHGDQAGGSLHENVQGGPTSVAGFMDPADKDKLDNVAPGATNTPLTAAAPTTVDAGDSPVAGVSTEAARADHEHGVSTGTPSNVGSANAEGTATDLARSDHVHAHGDQAGGSLHETVQGGPTSVAGFMDPADKDKLDGISAGAGPSTPLGSGNPAQVDAGDSASAGVSANASREDHEHPVNTGGTVDISEVGTANDGGSSLKIARADHAHAHGDQAGGSLHELAQGGATPVDGFISGAEKDKLSGIAAGATNTPLATSGPEQIDVGDAQTLGVSTEAAKADHQHALPSPAAPADVDKSTASAGASSTVARADHKHDVSTGTPSDVGSANAEGSATSLSRSDHVHAHGDQAGGSLHEAAQGGATPVSGFMTGAQVDALDAAATLTSSAPTNVDAGDSASVGVGTNAARDDHEHGVSTGTAGAIAVGDSAAEGTATDLARSDHKHSLAAPAAPANVDKSAAAAGVSSNVARQDHKHDVSTAAPSTIGSANAEGSASSLARSDHVHAHGDQAGGSTHELVQGGATPVAGYMSAADKDKIDALSISVTSLWDSFTPTALTADVHNYAPGTAAIVYFIDPGAATREITGFSHPSGNDAGTNKTRFVVINNISSSSKNIKFKQEDAGSTAGNRFEFGGDRTISAGESIIMCYHNATDRWRLVSRH